MDGPPTSFWGKCSLDQHGTAERWHPLVDHSADVAACCQALLHQPGIRHRLARLGGLDDLAAVQTERMCVLAALHDIGKFNSAFQAKARPYAGLRAGHVKEVLVLFGSGYAEAQRLAEALGVTQLARWVAGDRTLFQLLIAAICHHGRPLPIGGSGHDPRIWASRGGLDPFRGISALAREVRRWFPQAFEEDAELLPPAPEFQHAFSGLLMLADWLGSDERFFPFSEPGDPDRFAGSRGRACDALRCVGLEPAAARAALGRDPPGFDRVCDHRPHDAQATVLGLPLSGGGTVTVLESETGSGKTEAALARFLVLFHAGAVDGLYFALPTRTSATQMHRRVLAAVERAFGRVEARPPVVLAVPGYLAVDHVKGERRLPGFEVLWNDDESERFRFRGWAAENPKRYLAGAVVVGTIDQVLLSALAVPHAHLRASALLRHLLVVDEVHASDSYMTRILEEVLTRHLAAGGHALLMSATLGASARERLLAPGQRHTLSSLEASRAVPYPAVMHRSPDGSLVCDVVASPGNPKTVERRLLPCIGDPAAIAARALAAAREGARVLVVRNLVRDCVATQEALEFAASPGDRALLFACREVAAPHHARFAREDRILLDRALEERFGKDARPGGCVGVATQTVQQSVDIDADLLFSDLCPMDVLLQRIGRLHRHSGRSRPRGHDGATVNVLVPPERDLGSRIGRDGRACGPHGLGTVYEDLLVIEATWRELERRERLETPSMCRDLVEATTHPEALDAIAQEFGGPWISHATARKGIALAHRRQAGLNLSRWDVAFGDNDCLFPDGALDRRIQTRLGQGDRLAHLPEAVPGPFGARVRLLTMPAHLAAGVPEDAVPTAVEAAEGRIRFTFGNRRFVYDRLGLRPSEDHHVEDQDVDG